MIQSAGSLGIARGNAATMAAMAAMVGPRATVRTDPAIPLSQVAIGRSTMIRPWCASQPRCSYEHLVSCSINSLVFWCGCWVVWVCGGMWPGFRWCWVVGFVVCSGCFFGGVLVVSVVVML